MRRSPGGGDAWSGMGLDQALPKRGAVPNNVARLYDGPPGPARSPVGIDFRQKTNIEMHMKPCF